VVANDTILGDDVPEGHAVFIFWFEVSTVRMPYSHTYVDLEKGGRMFLRNAGKTVYFYKT
jgi:hypothetical protein